MQRRINKNLKGNDIISEENDNVFSFVTTIASVILILIATYFIIGLFFTKEINFNKKDKKETKEVTIDNNTITAGQIFNKKDSSYYVIVYDVDSKLTNLSTFISTYKSSEGALPIYTVDSANKINSSFIVEKNSNTNPTSYSDLKIKAPTLIKIEDKKVTSYIEDEKEIKNILKGN